MLRYTNLFKGQTRKLNIDPQHRAMADLMILGWNQKDAYLAVGLYNASFADEYHLAKIAEITESQYFVVYLQKKQRALARGFKKSVPSSVGSDEEESTDGKFRTKDEVIDALVSTVADLRGKDKADVLMKIADLQQMKKDEIVGEDNTVHFFVPVTCHMCDLYTKEKKRLERIRKKEDSGIDESDGEE